MKLKTLLKYISPDYWEKKKERNLFYKSMAIAVASLYSFESDKCFDKAATLTFYSLLAIIPLLAISFGVAQELGLQARFESQVKIQLETQPEIAEKIIQFADAALKRTKGGILATTGLVVLLWTVVRLVINIEVYFNEIWRVKAPRTIWQQVCAYAPLILFFPIYLVASGGLIIYLTTRSFIKIPILEEIMDYVPFFFSAAVLWFTFYFLPHTKVTWKSSGIAALIIAIFYQIWQWIYINFQVHASSWGAIYGSFAAIPLFLIWVYYSWLLVLLGAVLSSQIQKH